MSNDAIPTQVRQFLGQYIKSVEQLEILLLLSGNPHKWWTATGVYEVIKSSVQSVQDRLNEMVARGILRKEAENEVRFQFKPTNDAVWNITSELRDAYKERSVKVVQAIYSKPPDAVQEFARAFRVRKEK